MLNEPSRYKRSRVVLLQSEGKSQAKNIKKRTL